MKHSWLAGGLAVLGFVAFAAEDPYPRYVVKGDGNVTNALDSLKVEVTASEGAASETKDFAALDKSTGNFSGTFVFDTDNVVVGTTQMTNFTGVIRIKSGALVVDVVGCLGPASSSTAPKLYIEEGASLVPTCAVVRGCKIYHELHLAGTGFEGKGAFCSSYRAGHGDYCFYGAIYLDEDAMIGFTTVQRIDMGPEKANRLYLQDHTLTIRHFGGGSTVPTFTTYGAKVVPGSGHIVVDHVSLLQQGSSVRWDGGPTNTITLLNGAAMNCYNTKADITWTLITDATSHDFTTGGQATCPCDFPATNYNYYSGPMQLGGRLNTDGALNTHRGITYRGDISGEGWLKGYRAWIQLIGSNTYSGATVLTGEYAGLALWNERAASTASRGYFLTNTQFRLVKDASKNGNGDDYDLPYVDYFVGANTNFTIGATYAYSNAVPSVDETAGGMNVRMAALRKSGPGTLTLAAKVDVTGRTEIVAGTLKLSPASAYSAYPGLWEGVSETNAEAQADFVRRRSSGEISNSDIPMYNYYASRACYSNRVTSGTFLFGTKAWPHHPIMSTTYKGYIWNRTPTNQTVTFIGSFVDAWSLRINNSYVGGIYDSARLAKGTATLKPGPNDFELRGWINTTLGGGWLYPSVYMPNWRTGMGFAMAYGKTDTEYRWQDYFVPENAILSCVGGDGCWFTRDARAPGDFTAEELATTRSTFAELVVRKDATIDLAGSPLFVRTLEGAGTVANGDLTVKDALKLTATGVAAGTALTVDGKLTFADGARLVMDDEGGRKLKGRPAPFTVATAKDGIEGLDEIDYDGDRWRFRLSDDGKSLTATYVPAGSILIIK